MLSDRFGRSIDYLRVSVTDRCDLRCTYCMPKDFKGYEHPLDRDCMAGREAIELKPREHDFGRQPEKIVRFMSQTGG